MRRCHLIISTLIVLAFLGCDSGSTSGTTTQGAGSTTSVTVAMVQARVDHQSVTLANGTVVLLGGRGSTGAALTSVEIFNGATAPGQSAFSFLGDLLQARYNFGATLLSNGLIFVTGGEDGFGNSILSTELFNPATGLSTAGPNLNTSRYAHAQFPYVDGGGAERVAVCGGLNVSAATTTALLDWETYDVAANGLTVGGNLADNVFFGRPYFGTETGIGSGFSVDMNGNIFTHSLQDFDPVNTTWAFPTFTPGTMEQFANSGVAIDSNGNVLLAGGSDASNSTETKTARLFDPNQFDVTELTEELRADRSLMSATTRSTGDVVLIGGFGSQIVRNDVELWDGSDFTTAQPLAFPRFGHTVNELSTGELLVCGGDSGVDVLDVAEIIDP